MAKKRGYRVKLTDWGIAYAYGDINNGIVEINRELRKYPKLLKKVMKHELLHLKHPSFWSTVKIDLKDMFDFKKQKLLSRHLKKHPLMKIQSSIPVWYHKEELSFNSFLLFFYAIALVGISLILVTILGAIW